MDLAVVGAKALLIPTPGQIEQEYLSQYHNSLGSFYSTPQYNIDLLRDVQIAQKTTGIGRECDVNKTVEAIINLFTTDPMH
jgi:hypothetical protein